jgi:fumarate reductase subunit C
MTKNINRWPTWAHMFFVSSILISHDAMYWVARMFEGDHYLVSPTLF